MPILHPDPPTIPPDLFSEQVVLNALRTLPPSAHVFVRLQILDETRNRDREIDFLVMHPELGLVIIETKGRDVAPEGEQWFRRGEPIEHPGEQLLAQQYALRRFLKAAGVGFLPEITRVLAVPFLPVQPGQGLGPSLPACRVLSHDKLRDVFLALREAVAGGSPWAEWRLTPAALEHEVRKETCDRILAAMRPQLMAPPPLALLLEAEGRLQETRSGPLLTHLAQNFSRGRYHLEGAPGSGKSLLARMVTRLWAAAGRRVLVLAFNKAIVYATQCELADLEREGRALVSTFHDLAYNHVQHAGRLPESVDDSAFYNTDLPAALAALMEEPGFSPLEGWDALVVDEAQDLEPAWVDLARRLLRDPLADPVLLVEDPSQNLYREVRHDLGMPWRLDLNLRQHPAIRREVCLAYPACGWEMPSPQPDDGAVRRVASAPGRWQADLAGQLTALAAEGVRPEQVLILSPHRLARIGLRDGQRLGPWCLNTIPDWWEEDKAGHVRAGTVHGFKGLEADVVIYLAPAYPHPLGARLAYAAYSRARLRLIVIENAIARPAGAEPARPDPEAAARKPAAPQIRTFNPEQRALLMGALSKARTFKPGQDG